MNGQIKITNKGKVSMALPHHLKYLFKNMLELFINDHERHVQLDLKSVHDHLSVALMDEIYRKYHTQLSLINGDIKIQLTLSQAYALWYLCQMHEDLVYSDPSMGNLLMQLHQKL